MEWILTKDDRKRLQVLEKYAVNEAKDVLNKVAAKKYISLDDIKAIKGCLPGDAPLAAFYTRLTPYREDTTYHASPEFRAKTEALRKKQENMVYKKIIQSVDPTQNYGKVDLMENFGAELKVVNRQLMSIFNVVLTVVCAFFFGFSGVQFAYPHLHLDLATRFLIGLAGEFVQWYGNICKIVDGSVGAIMQYEITKAKAIESSHQKSPQEKAGTSLVEIRNIRNSRSTD
ncbi:unnamed protein product [Cylicocyclus nassatus]|uniref:Uncharacterized protein n=1 Tax=Cylicocyclus nassatus TaxID=53992 RepID=A0AA36HB98_CYLNA|nr:unnamed protein product [Cylicocyclus nassatus]